MSVSFADLLIRSRFEKKAKWNALSDEDKEALLMRASFEIDALGTYASSKVKATQLLEFPRVDFGIPTQLFYAVSQFVLDITNLVGSTSSSSTGGIKSEKIGRDGLAYSYFQSKVSDTRAIGSVASYLEPFFIKTFTLS
jgi:hypothetical protein